MVSDKIVRLWRSGARGAMKRTISRIRFRRQMMLTNKQFAVRTFCVCAVMLLAAVALAAPNVPSIAQVYQAARAGHLAQAEAMTNQVLIAYPNSARAHYVMAQIL